MESAPPDYGDYGKNNNGRRRPPLKSETQECVLNTGEIWRALLYSHTTTTITSGFKTIGWLWLVVGTSVCTEGHLVNRSYWTQVLCAQRTFPHRSSSSAGDKDKVIIIVNKRAPPASEPTATFSTNNNNTKTTTNTLPRRDFIGK